VFLGTKGREPHLRSRRVERVVGPPVAGPPGGAAGEMSAMTEDPRPRSIPGAVSVLFDRAPEGWPAAEGGDFVVDLHLDEIASWLTARRDEYDLRAFFFAPCPDVEGVAYRHEVFRDLESTALTTTLRSFADGMRVIRGRLARASTSRYRYERERWLLEAVGGYVLTVAALADGLDVAAPRSRGLGQIADHVRDYVGSGAFARLRSDAARVAGALEGLDFRVRISGRRVVVSRYEAEPDYGAELLATFGRFRAADVARPEISLPRGGALDHVEAAVLEGVAEMHPDAFAALLAFAADHRDFIDADLARFDREIQFYLAYGERIDELRSLGLEFCYPEVSAESKATSVRDTFDVALAAKLAVRGRAMVTNGLDLEGSERIVVVTGPNQGGKTTFARAVGQLHHLARLGCPVPGTKARVFLVDAIHTHFERSEDLGNLAGKLEDDLQRIRRILGAATPRSLLVMNESFSSTTVSDALFLNEAILGAAVGLDILAVVVTFLDELASLTPTTVSLVAAVDPADPGQRTFTLERRPADGLAYAEAIARKHELTYELVKRRVAA